MKFAFIQFIRKDVSNMERGTFKRLDSRVRNVIGCFAVLRIQTILIRIRICFSL
jgi:hypothetical protein